MNQLRTAAKEALYPKQETHWSLLPANQFAGQIYDQSVYFTNSAAPAIGNSYTASSLVKK